MVAKKEESVRLNIILTKKDLDILRTKAEQEDSSLSRIVRLALRKYLSGYDKDKFDNEFTM